MLPARSVLRFLLIPAELYVIWEQSVSPVGQMLLCVYKDTYVLEDPSH